jgi:subtilisin family serine protease
MAVMALAALAFALVPSVSARPTTGWGLDRIDQRALPLDGDYTPPADGAGVTIYLIDTGLDTANAQFNGRATLGANFTNRPDGDCGDEMGVGHGTFVAGIAGGDQTGVANAVQLVALQAITCAEGGSSMTARQERRAVVKATRWIRRNGVRPAVVNMSLAFRAPHSVDRAVRRLIDEGFPVVAAAGNEGQNACDRSPARVPQVITAGASTQTDRAWRGSNQGRCIDLFAPGKDITSVLMDAGVLRYEFIGATSWAAPFVSGAAALFLQNNPTATPAQVSRALRSSATTGALGRVRAGTPNRLLFVGGS